MKVKTMILNEAIKFVDSGKRHFYEDEIKIDNKRIEKLRDKWLTVFAGSLSSDIGLEYRFDSQGLIEFYIKRSNITVFRLKFSHEIEKNDMMFSIDLADKDWSNRKIKEFVTKRIKDFLRRFHTVKIRT